MPHPSNQTDKERDSAEISTLSTSKQKSRPTPATTRSCLSKVSLNEKRTSFFQGTSREEKESKNETEMSETARQRAECDRIEESIPRPKTIPNEEDSDEEEENKEFLKFLELEPPESKTFKRGRTACTITKKLSKPPNHANFGFSICWTNPPRVDGIKPGYPAESCGLKCGDYIIFVDKTNVTMKGQGEVLGLFEEAGHSCSLEIYRPCKDDGKKKKKKKRQAPSRSISTPLPAACEVANESQARTSTSMDMKKSLDLPDISPIFEGFVGEPGKLEGINQLVNTEKHYITSLQFGIARFLLPLAERKDLCSPKEHGVLFQNSQDLLRISEDILEKINANLPAADKPYANNIGEIYYNKFSATGSAYRKYCCGLKKSFCVLAEKTRNNSFMAVLNEPPIPKKRPDLIGFLHKPLEHFRLILKLLQGILNCTAQDSKDYQYLLQVVNQYQSTYKEITVESGLMEPKGEGKPLLTLQDLESRLVFTRCKPFALETSGRSWIFGGDLTRIEGNVAKRYWALLFTDIIVFAKVSRDRVIFITEEPLPLLQVVHAVYNIRRKETDFRLVVSDKPRDVESPVASSCGNLSLPMFPNVLRKSKSPKHYKRQLIRLRAPTIELKAVWQNLINRQVINLNTGRGTTPIGTPDSQDLYVDWENKQQRLYSTEHRPSLPSNVSSTKAASDIIEFKCNKLAKMGYKENAIHMSKWLKGEIGSLGTPTPGSESEFDIWSDEALKKRTSEINSEHEHIFYTDRARNISRCEVVFMSANPTPVPEPFNCQIEAVVELHDKPKSTKTKHKFEDEFTEIQKSICLNCQERGHSSCHKGRASFHTPDCASSSINNCADDVFRSNVNSNNLKVPGVSVVAPKPPVRGRLLSQTSMDEMDDEFSMDEYNVQKELPNSTAENENDVPYLPLNTKSKLKKFNTRLSLEKLSDTEDEEEYYYESDEDVQHNAADDNDDEAEYSDDEEQNDGQIRIINILTRASSFMGEKFATIEKLVGDDKSVAFTFFDRYLRSKPADSIKPLPATSTTLGGEDDCETLSGSEKWGTPTSGGESELQSPVSNEFSDEMDDVNPLDIFLAATHITTVNVRFPPTAIKSRLDPLPEDEEESYYSDNSSSNTNSKCVTQDEILNDSSSTHTSRSLLPINHNSQPGFFNRLLLRRSKSVESSPSKESTKLKKYFSRAKSEDNNSSLKNNNINKNNLSNSKLWPSKDSYSSNCDIQNNGVEKNFWNHMRKKDKVIKKLK